jgi:shikimate kinase
MRPDGSPPPRIVLVGLPGAGKSTVGRLVAERLGWMFVDLDRVIEEEAGATVAAIFAAEGEEGFRAREREATRRIADQGVPLVLAPGGGWVEDPQNLRSLGEGVISVHLRVSVPVALSRIATSGQVRPLLGAPDPAFRLEELRRRREPLYLQSNHTLSVDSMTPDDLAASIVAIASGSRGD